MDINKNKSYLYDFYNINEITNKYNAIVLVDVVEHLPYKTFISYLKKNKKTLLKTGGKLIISIPNIYYLGNTYFTTHEHVRHYSFHNLYLLLKKMFFQKEK